MILGKVSEFHSHRSGYFRDHQSQMPFHRTNPSCRRSFEADAGANIDGRPLVDGKSSSFQDRHKLPWEGFSYLRSSLHPPETFGRGKGTPCRSREHDASLPLSPLRKAASLDDFPNGALRDGNAFPLEDIVPQAPFPKPGLFAVVYDHLFLFLF